MAGPICFSLAFGTLVYLYAQFNIDPTPPGQLGAGFWPKMCLVGIVLAAASSLRALRSIGKSRRKRADA